MATFIVRGSSSVAASVHGPHSWTLTGPRKPSSTSSRTSRSEESMDLARARSRPGRSASAPAARGDLDRDVDQQRGRPSGQVRARAAVGQLGEVREAGEFPGDHPHRLARIGAGHRADPGGASGRPRVARPVMVIMHMSSLEPCGDKPRSAPDPATPRPGPCPGRGVASSGHAGLSAAEIVVAIPRPVRVAIGTSIVPADIRRLPAGAARPVLPRIDGIASPVGQQSRHGHDSDDPGRNSDDEKSAHDGYDRVVHRYAQSRGRKCVREPPKRVSRLAPRAAAPGAAPVRENCRSSFRTATATIATAPSTTPPRKTASIKYATDAALPLMTASPHPADGADTAGSCRLRPRRLSAGPWC